MAKWWCLLAVENYMFRPIAAIIRFWQDPHPATYKSIEAIDIPPNLAEHKHVNDDEISTSPRGLDILYKTL